MRRSWWRGWKEERSSAELQFRRRAAATMAAERGEEELQK
jgi:hypothetical protein